MKTPFFCYLNMTMGTQGFSAEQPFVSWGQVSPKYKN
jgi:hypothetical protein